MGVRGPKKKGVYPIELADFITTAMELGYPEECIAELTKYKNESQATRVLTKWRKKT